MLIFHFKPSQMMDSATNWHNRKWTEGSSSLALFSTFFENWKNWLANKMLRGKFDINLHTDLDGRGRNVETILEMV